MNTPYTTKDFDYELPSQLIAQRPLPTRTSSRMLCVDRSSQSVRDHHFSAIGDFLRPQDVLIFNNTKVIPARLFGHKATGGKVECLVERITQTNRAVVHLRSSKSPQPGSLLTFESVIHARVIGREGALFELEFLGDRSLLDLLETYGHLPIPPYIERPVDKADMERYQTVFASEKGAVAAPTAALHFDQPMLDAIRAKGVQIGYVTLHVGAGTFMPVKTDDLAAHQMHKEWVSVDDSVCTLVQQARSRGGRVIAVGTTVVRSLETAWQNGEIMPFQGDTALFITPGYTFNAVDGLLTNFHLPLSTLLMLVCAFGGYSTIMSAYRHAVKVGYRFFSYGDAMLIY